MDEGYLSALGDDGIDPELKAHIINLVSALGGSDLTEVGAPYKLGDDALACLRDLKHWLKGYDEHNNKWDIARCISETNLVTVDLIEILASWEEEKQSDKHNVKQNTVSSKHHDRIALACLELLVPLTWPLELRSEESPQNHWTHAPHLARARLMYKRAILTHPKHNVLKACLRLAIPCLKVPALDRTPRDEGILNLVVYFFRNLLAIDNTSAIAAGYAVSLASDEERDLPRSSVISEYDRQNVLSFFLMMGSEMGHAVKGQDTALLECLFHMLRGVSVPNLYEKDDEEALLHLKSMKVEARLDARNTTSELLVNEESESMGGSLGDYLKLEKGMKRELSKHTQTRHNRFGTLVTVRYSDDRQVNISGADGIDSSRSGLDKLDAAKKWRPPMIRAYRGYEKWLQPVVLTKQSNKLVKDFAEAFLDAAFNPVFLQIRSLLRLDAEKMLIANRHHFLFLVGWFLKCYRARVDFSNDPDFVSDYGLVGAVLNADLFNQVGFLLAENFGVSLRQFEEGVGVPMIQSCAVCFKEILLTLVQMEHSHDNKDKEIANVLKETLFYDGDLLSMLSKIPAIGVGMSFTFKKESIELTHVLLKTLQKFSTDGTFYVKKVSRRRKKRQQQQQQAANPDNNPDNDSDADSDAGSFDNEENEEERQNVIRERKFSFAVFQEQFLSGKAITTYIEFLSQFRELTASEIGWCLSFFYRTFVKNDMKAQYYRLDFMKLLQMLVSKTDGLPAKHKHRRDFEKFVIVFMRSFKEAVERSPSLYIELLFSMPSSNVYYFSKGELKESQRGKINYTWEFVQGDNMDFKTRVGVMVAKAIDLDRTPMLEWLIKELTTVQETRSAWVSRDISVFDDPDADQSTTSYEDAYLNYDTTSDGSTGDQQPVVYGTDSLFKAFAEQLGIKIAPGNQHVCIVPKEMSSERLDTCIKLIKRYMFEPLQFPDGKSALDLLKRKRITNNKANPHADDSEEENSNSYRSHDGFIVSSDSENDDDDDRFNDERFAALDEEERARRLYLEKEKRRQRPSKKKSSKVKRHRLADDGDSDEGNAPKRTRKAPTVSRVNYKSAAFVSDSEDETDEEKESQFFERERRLREKFLSQQLAGSQAPGSPVPYSQVLGTQAASSQAPSSQLTGTQPQSLRSISVDLASSPVGSNNEPPESQPVEGTSDHEMSSESSDYEAADSTRKVAEPVLEDVNSEAESDSNSNSDPDELMKDEEAPLEPEESAVGTEPSSETHGDVSLGVDFDVTAGDQVSSSPNTTLTETTPSEINRFVLQKFARADSSKARNPQDDGDDDDIVHKNVSRPRLRAVLESDDE